MDNLLAKNHGRTGFICPVCFVDMGSAEALLRHSTAQACSLAASVPRRVQRRRATSSQGASLRGKAQQHSFQYFPLMWAGHPPSLASPPRPPPTTRRALSAAMPQVFRTTASASRASSRSTRDTARAASCAKHAPTAKHVKVRSMDVPGKCGKRVVAHLLALSSRSLGGVSARTSMARGACMSRCRHRGGGTASEHS